MIRVRFYTEDVGAEDIEKDSEMRDLCKQWFPAGHTLYNAIGCWENTFEDSLVIEGMGNYDVAYCNDFADRIKLLFNQHSVMFTREIVEATLR